MVSGRRPPHLTWSELLGLCARHNAPRLSKRVSDANELDSFTDVRELQKRLKAEGVEFAVEADESTEGPGSFMVFDPDGNPILVDQHV